MMQHAQRDPYMMAPQPQGANPHPGVQYRPAGPPTRSYPPEGKLSKEEERLQCFKYLLFAYNLILFLCGGTLLGIGIWMAVDRNFITYMVGNNLYMASIFLIVSGGALIFIISFLGCCGAITENKCMLFSFFIVLILIFLCLLCGGILAGVFRAQIGDAVKDTMTDTLTNYYAVDLHDHYNRWVTDAWDKAQERLHCCAVDDRGWDVYQQSGWFAQQVWTPEEMKPYVPRSCCVKDRFWRYINADVCQKWRIGPPGSPVDGAINRALYYDGCYDASLRYIKENSDVIIGLGISVALLLILGIVMAFILLRSM